jgi:hypothetical protein
VSLARRVLVLAAIKAVQLVVQDSAKRNLERPFARGKFLGKSKMRAFLRRFHLGFRAERFPGALRGHLVDFQLERVQHDIIGRIVDDDGDTHFALKRERGEIGRQPDVVAFGRDVFRQPIVLQTISEGSSILIAHLSLSSLYMQSGKNNEKLRARTRNHPA